MIVLGANNPDFNPNPLLVDRPILPRVPLKLSLSFDPSSSAFFSSYDI